MTEDRLRPVAWKMLVTFLKLVLETSLESKPTGKTFGGYHAPASLLYHQYCSPRMYSLRWRISLTSSRRGISSIRSNSIKRFQRGHHFSRGKLFGSTDGWPCAGMGGVAT